MKRILLVDDNPVLLKFMTTLLEKKGHHVVTAGDGLSALDTLKTYTPDIIFSDLVMPKIGGEKLCRVIRSMPELKEVFLIILSAIVVEEEIDVTEFGADVCIAKGPFNKMAENVLSVLDRLDRRIPIDTMEKIIGREDVYERVVTKELLSSKKHFEIIIGNMSEGIIEITNDYKIVYANPATVFLTGLYEEDLLGTLFFDLFEEQDRKRILDLLNFKGDTPKAITQESPVLFFGKQVSMNVLPFITNGEQHRILILEDVTERKRMKARLQQAQKMEAIGTLSGGIAHDFNNLLMGIQGNVSLMLLDVDSEHSHFEYLKKMEKIVKSGSKLTAQLLGYARKGKYEIKPLSLNPLIEETSEIFGRTRKEITIHRSLADDLFLVDADQGQIEQVLLNLYVNSWQAMPNGGDLFLETKNATHEEIRGKFYQPETGDYVMLTVADKGVGMDEKTRERIFDPFFTTKEMARGTGLGLASAYGIIKGHGGYIEVESEEGKGTTFYIFFPASVKEVEEDKKDYEEILIGEETVLLVDDEDMIVDVGEQILKILGYKVLVARNGKEALKIFKKNRDDIDIVILDMIMPKMGGGETYDKIKKIHPDVKILLSSGYSVDGQASRILQRGCNGFIQKPFNIFQLSQKIREVLEKKA